MDVGRTLIGIGLGFDVLGTLFISLDVLQSQKENLLTLDFVAWILSYQGKDKDWLADEVMTALLLKLDPHGNTELAKRQKALQELSEEMGVLPAAEREAHKIDAQNFKNRVDRLRTGFGKRAHLIHAAISLVALGGVLEFIGGVFF
ncbi:MAG: hypothetical protein ACRDPY_00290 [Streptosporangiaceae bacterium]